VALDGSMDLIDGRIKIKYGCVIETIRVVVIIVGLGMDVDVVGATTEGRSNAILIELLSAAMSS
jgi:hypothetical protein